MTEVFLPIPGGWGGMGMTHIRLAEASEGDVLPTRPGTAAGKLRVEKELPNRKKGKRRRRKDKPGKRPKEKKQKKGWRSRDPLWIGCVRHELAAIKAPRN